MNKWLVCLIFLSACTVGQDYQKPEIYADSVIRNELKTNQNYPLPAKWYANLHDEQLIYIRIVTRNVHGYGPGRRVFICNDAEGIWYNSLIFN